MLNLNRGECSKYEKIMYEYCSRGKLQHSEFEPFQYYEIYIYMLNMDTFAS